MQHEINEARKAITTADLERLTQHYNGHVRQAALERCATLSRSDLLLLAVNRLNDWVPAVREQARATVLAILPYAQPLAIIGTLEAMDHLRRARREHHSKWIAYYEDQVVKHVPSSILVEAMLMWHTKASPICFQLIKNNALLKLPDLIKLTLTQKTRLDLAREGVALIAQLPEPARETFYHLALHSHFGPARTAAIRALLWQSDFSGQLAFALATLSNPQPGVRAAVHHFLLQRGVDLRSRYRAMIAENPGFAAKINLLSLAACGHAEDIELFREHALSPLPSIRTAALLGWFKLDPAAKDLIALTALIDPAPRTRRLGLTLVQRHGAFVPIAELNRAFRATRDYRLLYMNETSSIWSWLESTIPMLACDDIPDAARAGLTTELAKRFHHNSAYYEVPTPSQLAFLQTPAFTNALRSLLANEPTLYAAVQARLESLRG